MFTIIGVLIFDDNDDDDNDNDNVIGLIPISSMYKRCLFNYYIFYSISL